jgi:hypothetical protein
LGTGKSIYVGGTLLSILLSLALYLGGRRETAIFVGLWAPTILDLGQPSCPYFSRTQRLSQRADHIRLGYAKGIGCSSS